MLASQDPMRMQERAQHKSRPHKEGRTGTGQGRFKIKVKERES